MSNPKTDPPRFTVKVGGPGAGKMIELMRSFNRKPELDIYAKRMTGFDATDQDGLKYSVFFVDDKDRFVGASWEPSPADRLFNAINNHQIFFK